MPDATVGYISQRVHGPLMQALAKSVNYHDTAVVDLFRDGAPLLGELQRQLLLQPRRMSQFAQLFCRAGLGLEVPYDATPQKELHKLREGTNMELIRSLKEAEHADTLFDSCIEDLRTGRMDSVRPAASRDLALITLSPRFGVEQGGHLCQRLPCQTCQRASTQGSNQMGPSR